MLPSYENRHGRACPGHFDDGGPRWTSPVWAGLAGRSGKRPGRSGETPGVQIGAALRQGCIKFERRHSDPKRRFFFEFCTVAAEVRGPNVSAFRWPEPRPIRTGPLEFESKNPLNLLSFFIFRSEVGATATQSRSGEFPWCGHKGFPQLGNFPPPGVPGAAFFCHTRPIGVLVGGGNGVALISP